MPNETSVSEVTRGRLDEIKAELQVLKEDTNPTEDDVARADTLADEFTEAKKKYEDAVKAEDKEIARAQRMEEILSFDAPRRDQQLVRGDTPRGYARNVKANPYDNESVYRSDALALSPTEYISRAEDAIEQAPEYMTATQKEAATALIHRGASGRRALIARQFLLTGSPEYHDTFEAYMQNPNDMVQRAALSLTSANGGYLVPFTLDPSVILTNSGSANPFRQIANVKQTATNNWNGVTSAGVNAAWLAEAGVVGDNSPTFGTVQITPQKAAAWVFGSYEILEDTEFATELPGLLGDAKDRLEEAAFATGTGTGQPKGVVTAATTTVTTAAVATFAIADIYALQAAVPVRFRRNAKFVMSLAQINRARAFDTAGGSSYWTNLGQGAPERILGGDLYESTTMATTITTGSKIAVYGDFSQYAIVDRIGMSVMYEPMVKDPTTSRPTGQGGWFAFWRVGADALVPGAFRVLVAG